MFEDENNVIIMGHTFGSNLFKHLLIGFKEAFSHSSLTIEKAFEEYESLNISIASNRNEEAFSYYSLLSEKSRKEIYDTVKQIIVFKASKYGAIFDKLDGTQSQVDKLYSTYFDYFDSEVFYYLKFDENGNFDRVATFRNLDFLFQNLPIKDAAYKKAYDMQKDNLEAFDYAISLDELSVSNLIEINNIVNRSDPDKVEGFKKTNNDIFSSNFTPVDKKDIPTEMQRLFYDYRNGFGQKILNPYEKGISLTEKNQRLLQLFEREALFHIKFERMHPFNDGNGRTGRILINFNLLKQNIAPILITDVMSDEYKKCINDYDVSGLAYLLLSSSSQHITNWISLKKCGFTFDKIDYPGNDKLADFNDDIDSYVNEEVSVTK